MEEEEERENLGFVGNSLRRITRKMARNSMRAFDV